MKEITKKVLEKKAAAAGMTPEDYISTMDTRYSVANGTVLSASWRKTWDTFTKEEAEKYVSERKGQVITESKAFELFDEIKWVKPSTVYGHVAMSL